MQRFPAGGLRDILILLFRPRSNHLKKLNYYLIMSDSEFTGGAHIDFRDTKDGLAERECEVLRPPPNNNL